MSRRIYHVLLKSSAAVVALACAPNAFAQDSQDTTNPIEQVVSVANRAPVDLAKVGNSVTVLDTAVIQQRQSVLVADALTQTPGITESTNGGPGTTTSVRIRGAEAGDTLVLIDGVQMNDPSSTDDSYDFGNLLVSDISRIEILRGSASTLYGSQAIGGVVNITTAQPQKDGLSGDIQGETGSLSTGLVKGGIGGMFDQLTFRVAGGFYSTNSVDAFDSHFGGKIPDPDHNKTFMGSASYAFTPDISLDLRAFYTDGKFNFDGFPPPNFVLADQNNYGLTRQFIGYAGLNVALFDGRLQNKIDYQNTDVNRATYLVTGTTAASTGTFEGVNRRLEYQGNLAIADGYNAVFGAQQENSEMFSASGPKQAATWITSYYTQLNGEVFKGLTLTAGGREDQHKSFGNHFTGQAAAAWDLPTGTILRASWGQGFKAPSLFQLYSQYGTLGLRPEQSNSWDAGAEQHWLSDTLILSASFFSRHTTNFINFLTPVCPGAPQCATQAFGYYANTGRLVTNGVELNGSWQILPALLLTSNYTHEIARDRTIGAATYGKLLTRRPNDTWNTAIDYTWPFKLSTGVSLLYRSASFDDAANTIKLSGYALLNLRASYPISDDLDLYARMDNATNKWYETAYQYGTWGRTAFIGLKAHF